MSVTLVVVWIDANVKRAENLIVNESYLHSPNRTGHIDDY